MTKRNYTFKNLHLVSEEDSASIEEFVVFRNDGVLSKI